jgi:hypothetical protein
MSAHTHQVEPHSVDKPPPAAVRRLRWLLLLVIIFLPLQGFIIAVVEEPYPSFRLPDFRGSPDQGGYVELDSPQLTVTFTDGSATVSDAAVFHGADAPDALVSLVFPEAPAPANPGGSVRAKLRQYADAWGVFRGNRSTDPRTIEWLRDRLTALYPGRRLVAFVVKWERERFTLQGVPLTSRELNTINIPLRP